MACSGILLTGCVDSAYDLSDIDKTMELKVDNLAIPINMEAVELSQVIEVKEGDKLKIVDGKYAVAVEGTFTSDPIKIKEINIKAPVIDPIVTTLTREESAAAKAPGLSFPVPHISTDFTYHDNDIDPSVKGITQVKTRDFSIKIGLRLEGLAGKVSEVTLSNLRITLPKGLTGTATAGRYDPATGVISLGDINCNPAGLEVELQVSAIDIAAAGVSFNAPTRTLIFKGDIALDADRLTIDPSKATDLTGLPSSTELVTRYTMSNLEITHISGMLSYKVEDLDIPEVGLSDLPDFLRQEGTDIVLNNPQIYLSLDNPLHETRLTASTGLELTAWRNGAKTQDCPLPEAITIGTGQGMGPYKYCLSPARPDMYPGFEGAQYITYPTLGNILSGNGIPDAIRIRAVNPMFPEQKVTDLRIGYDFGPITGSYLFFAPLALDAGSTIIYSDSDTGWSSDDLDDLTIETLTIKADVSSDVDATLELSGNPLDRRGMPMSGVEVSKVTIPANAKDLPIEITVTGDVHDLDGFLYKVVLVSGGNKTLAPDQRLRLKNIRAYVSGKYVTTL